MYQTPKLNDDSLSGVYFSREIERNKVFRLSFVRNEMVKTRGGMQIRTGLVGFPGSLLSPRAGLKRALVATRESCIFRGKSFFDTHLKLL